MIRINLANRKQPSYLAEGKSSTRTSFKNIASSAGSSGLVAVLGRIVMPLVFCVGAYFAYDYYTENQVLRMQTELADFDKKKAAIQNELKRVKGFESVKADLERNQKILRTKIDTIERLIRGRDYTVKALVTLSQALPKDVWLTELVATDTNVEFRGATGDLGLISDVMSRLGQTIYFKDVTLKNTTTDASGKQVNFELTARRD